jgi:cyclopropane-fatty-acyl-phospholipid synthase
MRGLDNESFRWVRADARRSRHPVITPAGMSIVDVENLRLHYARTIRALVCRFKNAEEQVRAQYGPLSAHVGAVPRWCAGIIQYGWMQLFQVVFVPLETPPPYWTRAEMYDGGSG